LAVEKLGGVNDAAVVRRLADQLHHPDRALREAATVALAQSAHGRKGLAEALLTEESSDNAWALARAQASFATELPRPLRAQLLEAACDYREADDRRSEPLFFLLREMDADWTREQLEHKAMKLRKKGDFSGALNYLRLLARDPGCTTETRFALAATGLKLSKHDLSPEARNNDPALGQFARLLHDPQFNVLGQVKKAKFLDAGDLFYLGFHFAEQNQREKEFGGQVLKLLVQRSPRSTLAKDARRKLKSEGIDD
jgi:hypothetical protein